MVLVGDRQHKCWLFYIPIYKRLEYGRKENYIELKNSEMRQIVVGRKPQNKYTKKISPQWKLWNGVVAQSLSTHFCDFLEHHPKQKRFFQEEILLNSNKGSDACRHPLGKTPEAEV